MIVETLEELPTRPRPDRRRWERFAPFVPPGLVVLGSPVPLQAPINPYDGGLLLTLARFTSLEYLPYRDLWTLYGPGPPLFGGAIMDVFGPGLLPIRLGYLALHAALALAVYLVARRFAGWALAILLSIPIATFAYIPNHFHFAMSITLILAALVLLLRGAERAPPTTVEIAIPALLVGSAFLGRWELAPVGAILGLLIWWWFRPVLGTRSRWVLAAALAPPLLFGIYLLAVVGWDVVSLNLVEYPLTYYPRPYCRGVPPVWGAAFDAVTAPFQGRLWTSREMVVLTGTYVTPILGASTLWRGFRARTRGDARSLAILIIGGMTLVLWLLMRARAGGEPHPVLPPTMLCAAILLPGLRTRARRAWVTAIAALTAVTILVAWLPPAVGGWGRWPVYRPLTGFADLDETFMYKPGGWQAVRRVVQRESAPGEPVFVSMQNNTGHLANVPLFYWLVDRPPASRFIEFNPCLTDRDDVQRLIVSDLRGTNVVIAAAHFPQAPPPLGPPATVLDRYLTERFEIRYQTTFEYPFDLKVLVRTDSG